MARSSSKILLETLVQLNEETLQRFKEELSEIRLQEGYRHIPLSQLPDADPSALVDLLLSSYGKHYGMKVAAQALRAISQEDLAERLIPPETTNFRSLRVITSTHTKTAAGWSTISLGKPPERISSEVTSDSDLTSEETESDPSPAAESETSRSQNPTACLRGQDKCGWCAREEEALPEEVKPESIQDPEGKQETYRVHFSQPGWFRCPETELEFEVRAAVTVQYGYGSWDQHLTESKQQEWMVAGPLFNIQAEPVGAVAAVHLPHFLCLAEVKADDFQMQIVHIVDGGMTLEKPTRVRPFHAVLENPRFSLIGLIWLSSKFKLKSIHSLVLLYWAVRAADTTLHLYLIPNNREVEKAIDECEMKRQSIYVDKPPQTHRPLHFGTCYSVSSNSNAVINPQDLEFTYKGPESRQSFIEIYIKDMAEEMHLRLTKLKSLFSKRESELLWDAFLRPGDVEHPAPVSEPPTGTSTRKTPRDLLVNTLDNLEETELKNFKSKLSDIDLKKGYDHIPKGKLENAKSVEVTELLISYYKMDYAVEVTIIVLEAINQKDLAKKLSAMRAYQE